MIDALRLQVNKASVEDIILHFNCCDDNFITQLKGKVNLSEYAQKLYENAKTIEARHNDELVGLVAVYCNIGDFGFITNVSVLPSFYGLGVATSLLNLCKQELNESDVKSLRLEVDIDNKKAQSLYLNNGFTQLSQNANSIMMQLELKRKI